MQIHAKISPTGRTRRFTSHYDMERIAARVDEIYEIEMDDIFLKGKQKKRVSSQEIRVNNFRLVLTRQGFIHHEGHEETRSLGFG